jgi:endonuclease/exonuclease/phosphatase family metal-dependent hydrolase
MKKLILTLASVLLVFGSFAANAGNDKADIKVMTQNQYLGADLGPIIGAGSPQAYATAIVAALQSISANNIPERAGALAESIADRSPHLVALQEVYEFECIDFGSGACAFFHGAFNDHLQLTTDALTALGADYYVAAELRNLTLPTPFMEAIGLPGLPVYLDDSGVPAMFVRVIDRDVILARGDVPTTPVAMVCPNPGPTGIGCHYQTILDVTLLDIQIPVKRGHVAVDAVVKGEKYRFVNTHLEVHILGGNPASAALQAAQASELNYDLAVNAGSNPGSRLIVAGDINSAPTHAPIGPIVPPYTQLTTGQTIFGQQAFAPMTDTWLLRPGKPSGNTCCQAGDLLNASSEHDERIDVVLARPSPLEVKANVMDAKTDDKTASGLWPSDHASVIAELTY